MDYSKNIAELEDLITAYKLNHQELKERIRTHNINEKALEEAIDERSEYTLFRNIMKEPRKTINDLKELDDNFSMWSELVKKSKGEKNSQALKLMNIKDEYWGNLILYKGSEESFESETGIDIEIVNPKHEMRIGEYPADESVDRIIFPRPENRQYLQETAHELIMQETLGMLVKETEPKFEPEFSVLPSHFLEHSGEYFRKA